MENPRGGRRVDRQCVRDRALNNDRSGRAISLQHKACLTDCGGIDILVTAAIDEPQPSQLAVSAHQRRDKMLADLAQMLRRQVISCQVWMLRISSARTLPDGGYIQLCCCLRRGWEDVGACFGHEPRMRPGLVRNKCSQMAWLSAPAIGHCPASGYRTLPRESAGRIGRGRAPLHPCLYSSVGTPAAEKFLADTGKSRSGQDLRHDQGR